MSPRDLSPRTATFHDLALEILNLLYFFTECGKQSSPVPSNKYAPEILKSSGNDPCHKSQFSHLYIKTIRRENKFEIVCPVPQSNKD
jgi:hypothetical protein